MIMRHVKGRLHLRPIAMENFAVMSLPALAEYEATLWRWAEKCGWQPRIVSILNAIYREVEWRAMSDDWYDKMSEG